MEFFATELFTKGVLPFLLVFVLVFAILQKSKIFGEGKKQIDALIALAIGLILIGVPQPRDYIVSIIPWLAVALVVLLVFLLIIGFTNSDNKDGIKIPDWVKKSVPWLALLFVVILVLVITNSWQSVWNWLSGGNIGGNVLIIIVIGIALWVALRGNDSGKKD